MVNSPLVQAKFIICAVALTLAAASCTSTGAIVLSDDDSASSPLTLPDGSQDPDATTDTTAPDESSDTTDTTDPADDTDPDSSELTTPSDTAPPGTVFETASVGAPVLLFDNGVSTLDLDGTVTPLANKAVTAASDLEGGIVFQTEAGPNAGEDSEILALAEGETEAIPVVSGGADAITLQGVTRVNGAPAVLYIRHSDPPVLERAPVSGGQATVLATLAGGNSAVESVHVEGPYVVGVWEAEDESNQGWVLYNAASGDRIGGTRIDGTDPCFAAGDCPEVVTISADGANIYRVVPSGSSYRLLVTRSANGQEVADIDLDRAADSWFPEQISVQGDAIIISRTQEADPLSATLPALVVNITDGTIFQLPETGLVRKIS